MKKDDKPIEAKSLNDIMLLGKIRNKDNPLRGLIGAKLTIKVRTR